MYVGLGVIKSSHIIVDMVAFCLRYRKLRQCKPFNQKAQLFVIGCAGIRFFIVEFFAIYLMG